MLGRKHYYTYLCIVVEMKIKTAMQTFWCTILRASMETGSHLLFNKFKNRKER